MRDGLALEVLAHNDVGRLIWRGLGVSDTRALALTCKDLHALRRLRLRCFKSHWLAVQDVVRSSNEPVGQYTVYAAHLGLLELLKWMHSTNKFTFNASTMRWAARGGRLRIVQWLRSVSCPWDDRACEDAARGGHLKTLKWLRANGCPWDWGTAWAAARGGHLTVLRWCEANGASMDVPMREYLQHELLPSIGHP